MNFVICIFRFFYQVATNSTTVSGFPNDFQGDFGDDKRKAVLIRGLETPFRDAERRVRLSPLFWYRIKVSKRLSGWFFADDKRKAVLIRELETPFWNAEKRRSDTRLSQKHASVEVIAQSCFETPLNALCFGWNCAMQLLRSDKAFLVTRTRDTERSMINATTRERRFETRFESRFDCGYWNEFLKRKIQPRCDLIRVWARSTFLSVCRDDKRKVVLKRLYNVSQKKKKNRTLKQWTKVVGCVTIIIIISWSMINMLSNDT